MGSGLASDTDALQLDAGFGAPGGHALPLLLNRVCICVIRVICGDVLPGARKATRLRRGYGAVRRRIDYLGASELTIFSNRGSPRNESQ